MKPEPFEEVAEDILDKERDIWQNIKEIETRIGWLKKDLEQYQELRKIL